jgi:hypothetical protein
MLGYQLSDRRPSTKRSHLGEFIPSSILTLLALILGFTFSLGIGRFEHRRELVIQEANSIDTAYALSQLLRAPEAAEIPRLLRSYLDRRIEFYDAYGDERKADAIDTQSSLLEQKIWNAMIETTRTERGAI